MEPYYPITPYPQQFYSWVEYTSLCLMDFWIHLPSGELYFQIIYVRVASYSFWYLLLGISFGRLYEIFTQNSGKRIIYRNIPRPCPVIILGSVITCFAIYHHSILSYTSLRYSYFKTFHVSKFTLSLSCLGLTN